MTDTGVATIVDDLLAAGYGKRPTLTAEEQTLVLHARWLHPSAGCSRETTHDALLALLDRLTGEAP